MGEQERRISACIEAFDAQGWHRTGTAEDLASARWLAGAAGALGLETELEPYSLNRIVPKEAWVEAKGRKVAGLPLFDAQFTGPAGVRGKFGTADSAAAIGVSVLEGEGAVLGFEELRRHTQKEALLLVSAARRPGLMAQNATHFKSPFGPPVLQVEGGERAWVEDLAAGAAQAEVVVTAERVAAESANVVARWPGSDAGAAPVVVTTPRSGWWHCASERGGGIASWLEVARRVTEARPAQPVWFVAFSGHELGHLGSDAFLERRPQMIEQVKTWVHFGANVGGAAEPATRVSASTAELLSLARSHLEGAAPNEVISAPAGRVLGLESQDIHSRGGRCISLLGGNAFFHLEGDRWPVAVDVASVAGQANAFAELVLELAK